MTRKEFNTFLKDWQVWRQDPNRRLPSKLFDRKRRRAYEVFNETFFTGSREPNKDLIEIPVKLEPPYRATQVGDLVERNTRLLATFKSTAASQWSTCELEAPRRKQLASPLRFTRNHRGEIIGIRWNPNEAKQQLEHWKWLLHNPRLALKVVQQTHSRHERLLDSALFL